MAELDIPKILLVTILTIIIPLFLGAIFSEEIHDWFWDKTGVQTIPEEINYSCGGLGMTKTITMRNYDDEPKENLDLTFDWPLDIPLTVEVNEIGSNAIRGSIERLELSTNEKHYFVYTVASMKPKETIEFDAYFFAHKCNSDFVIGVNKNPIVNITGRI